MITITAITPAHKAAAAISPRRRLCAALDARLRAAGGCGERGGRSRSEGSRPLRGWGIPIAGRERHKHAHKVASGSAVSDRRRRAQPPRDGAQRASGKTRITLVAGRGRCDSCPHVRQESQSPRGAPEVLRTLLAAGRSGTSDRAGERSPPLSVQRNATAPRSRGRVGWVRRVSREACWSGHALLRRDDALIGGNIPGKDPKDFGVLAGMDTSPAAL